MTTLFTTTASTTATTNTTSTTNTTATTAAETAASLEVTFDGRHYHFRQYRYERLDDAMRYAATQHRLPGFARDPAFTPQWLAEWVPTEAQRATMRQLGIGFDGTRFDVGAYHYDRLEDAMAFAGRTGAAHGSRA